MSVHFDVSKISFFGLDDWSVAVCAWRGCCLEVFARAEHSVADCIAVLENAGLRLSNEAHHPGAVARLRALEDCLARYTFAGHERRARQRIADWQKKCESRTLLAHGMVKATQSGVTFEPLNLAIKKSDALAPKALSRIEMLTFLAELERLQTLLHQQLGHIKALANSAKPVVPVKKPDPRSSPG